MGLLPVVPSRGSRSYDHVITRRSNANPLDLDANELLNVLDVLPCLAGQVVVALRAGGGLLPSGQGLVVDLDLGQHIGIRGEAVELLAVVRVGSCDLELVEVVEDIELGEVERGVVVASVRVLEDDKVEPSAAAFAAGCDADFVTDLLELLAECVQLLCWEGSAALRQLLYICTNDMGSLRSNTGGVCLHYTNDLLN